jgi:prepilin-type N-terminal cleavage/methylation domain-containing protein
MSHSRPSSQSNPAGFTLIEVLVSSAVLAIVLAVMFSALSTSMSLWRNTDNKIVADREARAIGLMMARDLANVVIPAATNLWPSIVTNSSGSNNVYYLKFLTVVPAEGQSATGAEPGDVCYVEYAVITMPSTLDNAPSREVRRLLWPSTQTYSEVIQVGTFPTNNAETTDFQSLGLYLLPANSMAARGLGNLASDANDTNFILLGTNMLPFTGALGPNNYPAAIEVNFAVADPTTLVNTDLINRSDYVLRNAGLYSFRIPLPQPAPGP